MKASVRAGRKAKSQRVEVSDIVQDDSALEDDRRLRKGIAPKKADEIRAQKIKNIKKQIAAGTYHVEAAKVAKAVVRSETARLRGRKRR
jgi:anti-sigma28 factor (negative regulator of flagellin synthesis)